MSKVLAKAGASLADIYDVKGSVAGVDELLSREVQLVHEMGAEIFSERFRTQIIRAVSGDIAQNTDLDVIVTLNSTPPVPAVPTRILGCAVLADTAARLSRLMVAARDPDAGQEFPIWVFSGATDHTIRIVDGGAAAASLTVLTPDNLNLPSMLGGTLHPPTAHEVAMRGRTSGFGAGTVEFILLLYCAFPREGGVNSIGLPIPSW